MAQSIRAVLFDLFDTLVDVRMDQLPMARVAGQLIPSTYGLLHQAVAERHAIEYETFAGELRAVDKEWRVLAYKEGRELTTPERFGRLLRRLGIEDPELSDRLTDVHMGAIRDQVETLEHHPGVLEELGRGLRVGLCSNFTHTPTALRVIEEAGLRPHLDQVVISADIGFRKPRGEIFQATLKRLDVSPGEAVHVGDNLAADVGGAAALGMRTVWLKRRIADPETALARHQGPPPTATLSDLSELPTLLRKGSDPGGGLS